MAGAASFDDGSDKVIAILQDDVSGLDEDDVEPAITAEPERVVVDPDRHRHGVEEEAKPVLEPFKLL